VSFHGTKATFSLLLLLSDTNPHKMCYNQTATDKSTDLRNHNSSLSTLPCWHNSTSKYDTSDNTTYVMFGGQQEDVAGIGYILLFAALALLLAMLYCLAMRASMVEASIRRNQMIATRRDSFSIDAMTLQERREYIDRVLNVKVRDCASFPFVF
jgi:hypothetical protein